MKAFGTITACFPFVDQDTRNILQFVVDEARDYDDFAERLGERALAGDVPVLLTYFAYFHAYLQGKYNLLRKLMNARVGSDLTHPFELIHNFRRGDSVEWNDFRKAMAAAIKMTDNDWMACHVYMAWRELIEYFCPLDCYSDYAPLDVLESKIKNDEEYNFFLSSLYRIKATRFLEENNIEEARLWYDSAISLATRYDDLEKLASLLVEKANMARRVNLGEALSILKVQKALCDEIGYVDARGLNAHCLGFIAAARGEYDAAIEYQCEYLAVRESLGLPLGVVKCVIASLYNLEGNGKAALELVIAGKKDTLSSWAGFPQIQEAWALVNLGRTEDATRILDELRESSLKAESWLAWIHFIEGLIDRRCLQYPSALFSLEKALDLFEESSAVLSFTSMALVHMTDVEIESYPYDKKVAKTELSGPWMQRLMKHVQEKELLGFAMQALLLQAKFRFKQGRITQSRKMVRRVLKSSEAPGMHYLKDMAEAIIPELLIS